MKKKIAAVVLGLVVILLFGAVHHRSVGSLNIPSEVSANWCSGGTGCQQPGNTACNQTPWTGINLIQSNHTASVTSPALGTNCTHHVIDTISAILDDQSGSGCVQAVNVNDSSTTVWQTFLGVNASTTNIYTFTHSFPITSFLHSNTDGTQTLVLVGMGPRTANAATVTFGGNCGANSQESVSVIGHDE